MERGVLGGFGQVSGVALYTLLCLARAVLGAYCVMLPGAPGTPMAGVGCCSSGWPRLQR